MVEHTWQMWSLVGEELTMALPALLLFSLAPGVLNNILETADDPTEGSTRVLDGQLFKEERGRWSCDRSGRSGQGFSPGCYHSDLSWALGRCAGPFSLAQAKAGVPHPRSPLGHEELTDAWAAVEAEAKALEQLPLCRHVGPLCSYMKDEIGTFLFV